MKIKINYATIEKELLAVIFALEMFSSLLVGYKVIDYIVYAAMKCLLTKGDSKPQLLRSILILHEFNFEINDKMWVEYVVVDHL